MKKITIDVYSSLEEYYAENRHHHPYLEGFYEFEPINRFFSKFDSIQKCRKLQQMLGNFKGIKIPFIEPAMYRYNTPEISNCDVGLIYAETLTAPRYRKPNIPANRFMPDCLILHSVYDASGEEGSYHDSGMILRSIMDYVFIKDRFCSVWVRSELLPNGQL
ncbi:hypothetical protein [Pontibacter saemangeumensis]|uniref:hypothetical protein n=1 Tax=Pontibacter saemangeumensis TaxID=1084525 RepID=UPI0031F16C03